MRPTISLQQVAGALAVLGTSAFMAACGGADKPAATSPVQATEVPSAPATPTTADAKPADPTTPSTSAASGAAGSANPTTTTTTTTPAAATTTTTATDSKKPAGKSGPGKKPGAGQASCGAGTCSADAKKKVL